MNYNNNYNNNSNYNNNINYNNYNNNANYNRNMNYNNYNRNMNYNNNMSNYGYNNMYNYNNVRTINKQKMEKVSNIFLCVALSFILSAYVCYICFKEGLNSTESVGGWYIILGIPIGLVMCNIAPLIGIIISIINTKKKKLVVSIIQVIFLLASILTLYLFNVWFISDDKTEFIFLIIYSIIVVVISGITIYECIKNKKVSIQ